MKKSLNLLTLSLLMTVLPAFSLAAEPAYEETEAGPLFSQAALDQMLAPVALYPDVLLSQVLIASTYPLEIVEASRWSRANPDLEGDAAVAAVEGMAWDSSIKALAGFPDLLQLMDENLTWTRRLGDAFLLQEAEVMETVQNLRQVALQEGSLEDLEHVVVSQEEEEIIVIEPRDVRIVYVPFYDTRYVYGSWWWYDYPPICWYNRPPVYHSSIGFHWSSGISFHTSFFYSDCYWPSRRVVVVKPYKRYPHHHYKDGHRDYHAYRDAPAWRHDPIHRRGVRYPSEDLEARHARHTASSISRHPLPEGDSRMSHNIGNRGNQRAIPADAPIQLTRNNRESGQSGPVASSRGTRQEEVTRSIRSASANPAVSPSDRANRLARSSEARKLIRTSQITRTTRTSDPKPVQRQSSSVQSSRKPEASSRSAIASNQQRSKPSSQAQPSRQSNTSTNRNSSSSSTSSKSTNYSNNSSSNSSGSSWKSGNSYASSSNRSSRQERASSVRQAIRPHQK